MSLAGIREKIDEALSTIEGLQHYPGVPSVVNPPAAFPALNPTNPVSYDFTAQNATLVYHWYIEVLVLKSNTLEAAQDALDPYLHSVGDLSIKAVIEAIDWEDHADVCRVTGVSNYGPAVYGSAEFLGARLLLDIWVSN
jgi:hypothetical protein